MPDIGGIPYVESSDLVSGWPTVSQSVAQEVSDQLASKLDLAGGKILQIVRATDGTLRTTTSGSFVDVTGMSVTITPQKSDSAIIILANFYSTAEDTSGPGAFAYYQITDSSNNAISGAEEQLSGTGAGGASTIYVQAPVTVIGYATPATTSAVTYKLRFKQVSATSITVNNDSNTGQMYAIEVSA